jgi:hypothetical protein
MNAREALLGAKAPTETVYIKALDHTFTLRGMTGAERDKFEVLCMKVEGKRQKFTADNIRAKLVAFCVINDDGSRAFSEDDAAALGESRGDVLSALAAVAQRLCGIGQADIEELGKSSAEATVSSLPSSPSVSASV